MSSSSSLPPINRKLSRKERKAAKKAAAEAERDEFGIDMARPTGNMLTMMERRGEGAGDAAHLKHGGSKKVRRASMNGAERAAKMKSINKKQRKQKKKSKKDRDAKKKGAWDDSTKQRLAIQKAARLADELDQGCDPNAKKKNKEGSNDK